MRYLLNFVYLGLLAVTSPWLLLAAIRQGKYREGFAAKFLGRVPRRTGCQPCVWLHAVSVGEVNLLKPLLARIEHAHPDWQCVISTTTKTGFDLACKLYSPRLVFYCPLDFSWAVAAALRRIRPKLLLLAELELWPNLIGMAHRRGVKVAIVNGRLSEQSFRGYRRLRPLVKRLLHCVDLIASQNGEYSQRFVALGAAPAAVHTTGSMKFDGARTDRDNPATRRLAALAGIRDDDLVFLAGSTQHPEENLALETYRALCPEFPHLRLILVPRHPERFDEVAALLNQSGIAWQRRSELDVHGADARPRVLLVDTVGELGAWWGTARLAFVGGSLGSRGGQNMIEPAAYGAAVCFGPKTQNFRDIVSLLLAEEAAVVVQDGRQLTAWVRRCLCDPSFREAMGRRAQQLVVAQQGATARTLALIEHMFDDSSASSDAENRAA